MSKPETRKVFFGLKARLILIVFILVCGITFITTFLNIKQQQEIISQNLIKNNSIVASLLRESAINHIDNFHIGELRILAANIIRNPEITYAYIFDELGTIMTDGTTENRYRDEVLTDQWSVKSVAAAETLVQIGSDIIEITEPVYLGAKKIGGVRVGASLEAFKQEKIAIVKKSIQLTIFYLFFALIIALVVAWWLTNPIHRFTNAIKAIHNGDTESYSNIKSSDEIGQLSQAFDEMLLNLRTTMASNDALDLEIENRIQTEEELRKASALAEQANIAKSEFLASMSHEIRTPMNGVLGMLGLLLQENLTDEQAHKATIAQTSAQSLLTLINDILDFSKVDAGKMDIEIMDFNLRSLLGDFAEGMALRAQEKGLELILDVTKIEQSTVKSDPGRLRQILNNIVGNAIKFTESGEIVICANLKKDVDDNLIFHCAITDTGIGIPEDRQSQLFEAFTQVDASTTRKYGGTGLGLSIAKKLCEAMGGSISVSSEIGKSTCFEFSLTFQVSHQSELVVPKINMSELNLLIVDDNKTNREVLIGQLTHWGAAVIEAEDGPSALDILRQRVEHATQPLFDVAFLDMQMPGMDGAMLGKAIKADPCFATMKLVMMTSMSDRGNAKFFADLGFDAFFSKPATTSDMFDALAVVVDGGDALDQASPLVTHHYLRSLDHGNSDDDHSANKSNKASEQQLSLNATPTNPHWPADTRLLLVEDNRINQLVALGVLKGIELTADVVANGHEALDSLTSAPDADPYTLILMDCQMPEMDGYEASRNIRAGNAGARNQSTPIIAMTANVMKGDREKCLEAGMSDYLSKPIDAKALKNMIEKWLV